MVLGFLIAFIAGCQQNPYDRNPMPVDPRQVEECKDQIRMVAGLLSIPVDDSYLKSYVRNVQVNRRSINVNYSSFSGEFTVNTRRCSSLTVSPDRSPETPDHLQQQLSLAVVKVLAPDQKVQLHQKAIHLRKGDSMSDGEVYYEFVQIVDGLPTTFTHRVAFRDSKFSSISLAPKMLPPSRGEVKLTLDQARTIALNEIFAQRPVLKLDILNNGFKAIGVFKGPEWKSNPPEDEVPSQIGYRFDVHCYEKKGMECDRMIFVSGQTEQVQITGPIPPYFGSLPVNGEGIKLTKNALLLLNGKRTKLPIDRLKPAKAFEVKVKTNCLVIDGKQVYRANLDLESKQLSVGERTTYLLPEDFIASFVKYK